MPLGIALLPVRRLMLTARLRYVGIARLLLRTATHL